MKAIIFAICLLFFIPSAFTQEEDTTSTFDLIDLITIDNENYRFRIQSDGTVFKLKTCLDTEACKAPYDFIKTMNEDAFLHAIIAQINSEHGKSLDLAKLQVNNADVKVKKLLDAVKAYDEKKVRSQLTEVQNRFREIENAKDSYSGKLVLNINKDIPYAKTTYNLKPDKLKEYLEENLAAQNFTLTSEDVDKIDVLDESKELKAYVSLQLDKGKEAFVTDAIIKRNFVEPEAVYFSLLADNNQYQKFKAKDYVSVTGDGEGILRVISATIRFFNNKAATIKVNAILNEGDGDKEITFINSSFSVPVRYFNIYGSTVSTRLNNNSQTKKRDLITVDYNDVFDYNRYESSYSYSIANTQIELKTDSKEGNVVEIPQRRFFDFFTAILYSDLMGFNTESSNSLVNAQTRLLLPLNLRNTGKNSLFRQFTAITNIALQNSFDDESRFINVQDDGQFNMFDLLRKNNLYGKFSLELFTHEAKGFFSNIGIGYNASFYRTGFRYTQTQVSETDIVTSQQLFSVGHGPFLNFEIRPQSNFGADITFSLEDLNYSGSAIINERSFNDDIIINQEKDHFVMPYNLINLEANFYWLTNPETSVGGLYAKLGAYFHTDTNSIFPQLMVGYATNLTSFVDKVKPKTKATADTSSLDN